MPHRHNDDRENAYLHDTEIYGIPLVSVRAGAGAWSILTTQMSHSSLSQPAVIRIRIMEIKILLQANSFDSFIL